MFLDVRVHWKFSHLRVRRLPIVQSNVRDGRSCAEHTIPSAHTYQTEFWCTKLLTATQFQLRADLATGAYFILGENIDSARMFTNVA